MSRYVDIDKPRYVRYTDERSGEVVTSEQTIAELLDGSIGLIGEDIVRCKDCRYWYPDTSENIGYCFEFMTSDKDGFCKWGERRE